MEFVVGTIIVSLVIGATIVWALTPPETEEEKRQREHDEYYHRYI